MPRLIGRLWCSQTCHSKTLVLKHSGSHALLIPAYHYRLLHPRPPRSSHGYTTACDGHAKAICRGYNAFTVSSNANDSFESINTAARSET